MVLSSLENCSASYLGKIHLQRQHLCLEKQALDPWINTYNTNQANYKLNPYKSFDIYDRLEHLSLMVEESCFILDIFIILTVIKYIFQDVHITLSKECTIKGIISHLSCGLVQETSVLSHNRPS